MASTLEFGHNEFYSAAPCKDASETWLLFYSCADLINYDPPDSGV